MADSVLLATVFFAGLTVGSFLNVVIHRGPVMWGLVNAPPRGDLLAPRSYCPSCGVPLGVRNLFPLASFLAQGGKCASCRERISWRYPVVETLGGACAVLSVTAFGWTAAAAFAAFAAFGLIALAAIDLETGYLPDALTIPLAALGLGVNAFATFATFPDAVSGAAAGFLTFWAIGELYRQIRNREGLGLGDAKLLGAIGAWTGWVSLPLVIFIAATATLAAAFVRGGVAKDNALPFGPGLCLAGFVALYFGDRLFSVL